MLIALAVFGISLLIILHELGHYGAARACGMRVERFSIGFGPKVWGKQLGETHWQVAAIPLGGFVQIHGMGAEEGEAKEPYSFRSRPIWQRCLVMVAGPGANWVIAAAAIALLAGTVGFHEADESSSSIGEIVDNSPAAAAGLLSGDVVRAVDNIAVSDWLSLVAEIRKHPDARVPFDVERAGTRLRLLATVGHSDVGAFGVLGVGPTTVAHRYGVGMALVMGVRGATKLTVDQASFLWQFATGQRAGRVSGLPGIVKMISRQAERGFGRLLESLALLSIGLFLLNLLPMPALDGGRLIFLGFEAARGRPVNQLIEGWVHTVGLVLLLALMVFVSVRDLL